MKKNTTALICGIFGTYFASIAMSSEVDLDLVAQELELISQEQEPQTRGFNSHIFSTNNGLAIMSASVINVLGGSTTSTSGSGSTVTINVTNPGNTIRVDAVYGNDATASLTGTPYQTITGALAVAQSGDTVLVYPGTYTITTGMIIPAGVSVVGVSRSAGIAAGLGGSPVGGVIVSYTVEEAYPSANTYAFTMNDSSSIQNIDINVTTSIDGLTFGGISCSNANISSVRIENCYISVSSTVTSSASAQNVYGVYVNSNSASSSETQFMRNNTIYVNIANNPSGSTAALAAGLYVLEGGVNVSACNIRVTNSGTNANCSAYGVYLASSAQTSIISASTLYASVGNPSVGTQADADSALTATYSLLLENTTLQNSGLTTAAASQVTTTPSSIQVWSATGTASTGATVYLLPGTGSAATDYTQPASILTLSRAATIKNLRVTALTGPSSNTNTFTLYKNGSSTSLAATLATSSTSAADTTHAINCNPGDTINMVMSGTGTTAQNLVISAEIY